MVAAASSWAPKNPFEGVTTADMQWVRQLTETGEYRKDSRSPDWIGYAIAERLKIPIAHKADNAEKDIARVKSIIATWLKNKVIAVEERKVDGKDREFIIPGSYRPEPTVEASDEDGTLL